jgi:murein DD-endopeptidase MepM/ murein hydrolase activator NlpD
LGDRVVAPEDGQILAFLPFHHDTWAVYIRLRDGRVINLAELDPYSWREFGVGPGDEVHRGETIARVGLMSGGSKMLHVELYDPGGLDDEALVGEIRRGEMSWTEDHPPSVMLDPSAYLVDAATRTYRLSTPNA